LQFQTLDNKSQCVGVYAENELKFTDLPDDLTKTWDYSSFLKGRDIEYAQIYCAGSSLDDVCPEHLSNIWNHAKGELKAHYKAFATSKIDMNEHCFYDMVPERMLYDYCEAKDAITSYVFSNYEKPKNYDFLRTLLEEVDQLSYNQLNLNFSALNDIRHKTQVRKFIKKYSGRPQYCRYNVFGTKTGRLTTRPNSFPILTMPKSYRKIIRPNNDWFLELDYNAAELRTVLGLAGQEQPQGDIHEWNIERIFNGQLSRDDAKQKVFAWLYGSTLYTNDGDHKKSVAKALSEVYRKEEIVRQHWTGSHVKTRFGRCIPSDHHHALNYIIQSSTVDITLGKLIELADLLGDHKSSVAFTLHDSVIIDLSDDDRRLVPEMVRIFGDTALGKFKTNVSAGKDFGNMRPLRLPQK
tara:strand:+ start:1565 stop:2791 length:1227 start_codon:yes stop_codon:yes gene_type:complete